jgi:hypothetical protein
MISSTIPEMRRTETAPRVPPMIAAVSDDCNGIDESDDCTGAVGGGEISGSGSEAKY